MRSNTRPTCIPELPALGGEYTQLIATEDSRSVLATLVVDHALLNDGPIYWIDTCGHATIDAVTNVAPSTRILDRIHVARGFTAYQHREIVESLYAMSHTEKPALIVAPAIDYHYQETMEGIDGKELLAQTVARLTSLRQTFDCPILTTTTSQIEYAQVATAAVTTEIECKQTSHGPRFTGPDFETLVYPHGDGTVQTTIAYWNAIIQARKPVYTAATTTREVFA